MTTTIRLYRIPQLPKYPNISSPGDYNKAVEEYRESLNRALFENFNILADAVNGTGDKPTFVSSITATAPVVVTPSPITSAGVISVNTFGASGGSHARGVVPDPGAGAGSTKFLREDATWAVPSGAAFSDPLTTKGDIWTWSTTDARLAVGANTFVLTADSTTATGLKWAAATGGTTSPLTTKGDVWGFSSVDARIPIGTNNFVLTADSAQTLGVKWAAIPASGVLKSQEFTGSGTFNVPTGVTLVWVRMIGGGGGGSTTILAAQGGGGGGSGEVVDNLAIPCSSGGTITVNVGALGSGGASGQASAQAGTAGGDTNLVSGSLTYYARGGFGGLTAGTGGGGGGPKGAATTGLGGVGVMGTQESPVYFGGGAGGPGGNTTGTAGFAGAANAGFPTAAVGGASAGTQAGGGGGANSPWGVGGAGASGGSAGNAAVSTCYGAGGGGSGGKATTTIGGGNGTAGYVLIQWVA